MSLSMRSAASGVAGWCAVTVMAGAAGGLGTAATGRVLPSLPWAEWDVPEAAAVGRDVPPAIDSAGAVMHASTGESASPAPRRRSLGPIKFVATDRDAGQVIALDADLFEVQRFALPFALEVELRSDGRIWAVSASALGPLGPHRLRRFDLAGQMEFEAPIGPLFDLACSDGDLALLVVARSDGSREALAVASTGVVQTLEVGSMLAAVAGHGGRALVAGHDGWLRSHALPVGSAPTVARYFGGVIADAAPGPVRGGFYVLDVSGAPSQRRLALLDEALSTVWWRTVGCGALHLAVSVDRQRVWLADGGARFARRFGPGGVLEIPFAQLPLAGVERGVAESNGGAVFAAPGALIRLAPDGALLPGQGGYDFLVDVTMRGQR